MGEIVKKGRLLSQELRDKLYYNDQWSGNEGGRDRQTPKKYSWICVRCGGEFIFKEQAISCCTKSDQKMRNALMEIETKGRKYRYFNERGGYDYYDSDSGQEKKPKVIDFILVVEKQIRLLEKELGVIPECQLKIQNEKILAFYKLFLPKIKELTSYGQVMEVIQDMDYTQKEVYGINPDYQCDHCPYYCYIRLSDSNHECKSCERHDCSEYVWQNELIEWEENKSKEVEDQETNEKGDE